MMQKTWKMIETLAYGYSSESTQQELSNEYNMTGFRQFSNLCVLVLNWTKEASALEGLNPSCLEISLIRNIWTFDTFENYLKIKHEMDTYLKGSC